jgi:lia operon protein LiaG
MRSSCVDVHVARCPDRNGAAHAPLILGLFILTLALAIAFEWSPALAEERFELHGDHVVVYNLAGEVEVVSGDGNAVVVHVTRGGRDADRLDVATGRIHDMETLRVLYPSRHVHYAGSGDWLRNSNTSLYVGDDGRFGDRGGRIGRHRVTVGSGSGLDAHADLRIEVPKGQRFDVYLAVGEASATDVVGDLRLDTAAAEVRTKGTRGNVVIDVGSGGVRVEDSVGNLNVDTGSGGVEIMKVRGDEVLIDTGSGGVSCGDIEARRVNVDTGSGSVELGALTASRVGVDTGSGGVRIDLRSDIESLSVDTGSGGVTVRMPETVGAELMIQSSSGGIRSELPIEVMHKDRDSLHGRIGDGNGRITIETGSGTVRLLKS